MVRLLDKPSKLGKIYRTLKIRAETSSITTIDCSGSSSLKITDEVVTAPSIVTLQPIQSTSNQPISSNDSAIHPTEFMNKTVPALVPSVFSTIHDPTKRRGRGFHHSDLFLDSIRKELNDEFKDNLASNGCRYSLYCGRLVHRQVIILFHQSFKSGYQFSYYGFHKV